MNISERENHIAILDTPTKKKKFLGIMFACCNVYARIYIDNSGKSYKGRCPRCLRSLSIKIEKNGVNDRFFIAF